MNHNQLEVAVRLTNEKVQFTGTSMSNPDLPVKFDYLPPIGDGQGYRGLELLLMSFTGCVSTSIVFMLRRAGKEISGFSIKATGYNRAQPLSLEKINLLVTLESKDTEIEELREIVRQAENLSPVWLAIKNNIEVTTVCRLIPDLSLAAACGLFCTACSLYIGTTEDPERLKTIAERIQRPVEDLECYGCRSEKRSFFCKNHCKMMNCTAEKGIRFCVECSEYPCEDLKAFQQQQPHRNELWESQERIKDAGFETWYKEMMDHYACPACGTINSAYDLDCRKCGNTPGSRYAELHKEEVLHSASKIKL